MNLPERFVALGYFEKWEKPCHGADEEGVQAPQKQYAKGHHGSSSEAGL